MLARSDATNTIFVVRADHGLQAGPVTSDYSIQVEALRPWTELILPKGLQGLALENIYNNRRKLTTGFDFYKTLTKEVVGADTHKMPEPPLWSSHLWKEDVSETRTCSDVKVSNDYCLFEGQRTFSSPNLRSCNLVEEDQQAVCPSMEYDFLDSTSDLVKNSFHTTAIQRKVCPRGERVRMEISKPLAEVWAQIDETASRSPRPRLDAESERPSPGQVAILTSIVSDLSDAILKAENRSFNVCQTGYGQGHSAAMFLEASPNVNLQLMARLNLTTQTSLLYSLQTTKDYQNRIKHKKCDSCLYMLELERKNGIQCDFLHGLSASSKGYAETIVDMVKKAPCGVILSSVASRSLRDSNVYFGAKNQWAKLRADECIEDIHCFADSADPGKRFCMAVTTGKCHDPQNEVAKCNTKIAEVSKRIVLGQLCPAHEVPVPMPLSQVTNNKRNRKHGGNLIRTIAQNSGRITQAARKAPDALVSAKPRVPSSRLSRGQLDNSAGLGLIETDY